jgi:hypothetical protein
MTQKHCTKKAGKIIQINEEGIQEHLGEVVRGTGQKLLTGRVGIVDQKYFK